MFKEKGLENCFWFLDPRPRNSNVSLQETKNFLPRMTRSLQHIRCYPWARKGLFFKEKQRLFLSRGSREDPSPISLKGNRTCGKEEAAIRAVINKKPGLLRSKAPRNDEIIVFSFFSKIVTESGAKPSRKASRLSFVFIFLGH